jgi:hypothetical protein
LGVGGSNPSGRAIYSKKADSMLSAFLFGTSLFGVNRMSTRHAALMLSERSVVLAFSMALYGLDTVVQRVSVHEDYPRKAPMVRSR